jgi:hypothetical protein
MRRGLAVLAIVVGIALIAEPFAFKLFPRAAAGQRVTDRFREQMSRPGLAQLQANFATVGDFTKELSGGAVPYFARRLHMTDRQFSRYLQSNFPAVATGLKEIPAAAAFVGPVIPQLVGAHDEFVSVDSLPGLGLPITAIPWLLIGLGAVLLAVGALVLTRPAGGMLPLAAVLVLGLGMVAVPFAFSLPSKADDASNIAAVGRVALSQQAATKAAAATKVIDATVTQTRSAFLPAMARRLQLPPARLDAILRRDFPAVPKGLHQWDSIRPGAYHLTQIQAASVSDNRQMNDTPFHALPWIIVVPGVLLALLATACLVGERRSRHRVA